MNEFAAKKIGEVLAFEIIGQELFDRGAEGLREVFHDDYEGIMKTLDQQADRVEDFMAGKEEEETTSTKAQITVDKLRGMMETYIGDEWDDPAELLEWLGFFEGAAVLHWALVQGMAVSLESDELNEIAEAALETHHNLLHRSKNVIEALGREKATE